MQRERWRAIPSLPGYDASTKGRIRKVRDNTYGSGDLVVQAFKNNKGYERIGVRRHGRSQKLLVHRLICEAFHGPSPKQGLHAAHLDGNPENNAAWNLCWMTASKNIKDGWRMKKERILHGCSTAEDEHRRILYTFPNIALLARNLGVSGAVVYQWRTRNSIPGAYWEKMVDFATRLGIDKKADITFQRLAIGAAAARKRRAA